MKRIVSSISGRIRLRDAGLRDPLRLERLNRSVKSFKGVLTVEANRGAGSLVVHYDPAQIDHGQIEAQLEAMAGAELARPVPERRRITRVQVNRYAKRGMLASLAVSLLLAATGQKRWHALSGAMFVACLMVHLAIHRRHLVR